MSILTKLSNKLTVSKKNTGPKLLFFDIETAGLNSFAADMSVMLCFGYKFEGDKKARCITILDYPGKHIHDDTNLVKAAHEIMEQADLLVAHYGERFDKKYIVSKVTAAGLSPIPETRLADTCLIARAKFRLSNNRLDTVARFLNASHRKIEKGDLWPAGWMLSLRGDRAAIKEIASYCIGDVECLQDIFNKMRPVIPARYLINARIGTDRCVCLACGSNVQYRGTYISEKRVYRRFTCTKCGRWGHDAKPIMREGMSA